MECAAGLPRMDERLEEVVEEPGVGAEEKDEKEGIGGFFSAAEVGFFSAVGWEDFLSVLEMGRFSDVVEEGAFFSVVVG